jgi:F-type H+-transporting ATPase subunit a
LVLLFFVLSIVAASFLPPIAPHIQVAPENITQVPVISLPVLGDMYLTNTLVASFLVMLILIVMAFFIRRAIASGEMVPRGFSGAIEAAIEALYNLAEGTAGRWARTIFPWFATIIFVVLLANWMELIPGVDSFGSLIEAHGEEGYPALHLGPFAAIVPEGTAGASGHYEVIPWIRVASTDLNFTGALALIAVIATQVIGVQAQGGRYFTKFVNFTTMFKKPFLGAIDFAVGILETISELSRILSFAFRLFGNIFAGMVLLILVGTILPAGAKWLQSAVLVFEFFIGAIQAFVFGMLTLVFMTMATQGHGGEHEEGH